VKPGRVEASQRIQHRGHDVGAAADRLGQDDIREPVRAQCIGAVDEIVEAGEQK